MLEPWIVPSLFYQFLGMSQPAIDEKTFCEALGTEEARRQLMFFRNTWVTEEGTKILEDALMIDEIIPKHFKGLVLSECPNPKYVSVLHPELRKRVNVLIPRKWQGKLVKKVIIFEAIEDTNGVSYRYVSK